MAQIHDDTMRPLQLAPLSSGSFQVVVHTSQDLVPERTEAEDPRLCHWRAELRSTADSTLSPMVLQIPDLLAYQADDSASDRPHSMAELEIEWSERLQELWELHLMDAEAGTSGALRMVLPAKSPDGYASLPPLISTAQGVHALPCPHCLEPLSICRDEGLLAQYSLPSPARGWQVVLSCSADCPRQLGDEAQLRLFVAAESLVEGLDAPCCGHLGDLRAVLRETLESDEHVIGDLKQRREMGLLLDLPWKVLTDRDLPFALMIQGAVDFDRASLLLGGGGLVSEAPGNYLLFAYQGTGLDAVELLFLKLCLFRQALKLADDYHRRLGRPHLDLFPGRFTLCWNTPGFGLPQLWGFKLSYSAESAARSRSLPNDVEWIAPAPRLRKPYASPALSRAYSIEEQTGQLVAERWLEERESYFRLEARLIDPNGIFPRPSATDWIRIRFVRGPFLGTTELIARVDPRVSGDTGSLTVVSEPVFLDPSLHSRAVALSRQEVGAVAYRLYPILGVGEDLYSLGMLLLRILLVNDRQDMGMIAQVIQTHADLKQRRDAGGTSDHTSSDHHAHLLSANPEMFSPSNVFFAKQDRSKSRPNSIPLEVWQSALSLALDLISQTNRDGSPSLSAAGSPEIGYYQSTIDELIQRLRILLFRTQPVHLEIHSVIANMLSSSQSTMKPTQ